MILLDPDAELDPKISQSRVVHVGQSPMRGQQTVTVRAASFRLRFSLFLRSRLANGREFHARIPLLPTEERIRFNVRLTRGKRVYWVF